MVFASIESRYKKSAPGKPGTLAEQPLPFEELSVETLHAHVIYQNGTAVLGGDK